MKKFGQLLVILGMAVFISTTPVLASGDQVKVNNSDGVMYLSTELENDPSYQATSNRNSTNYGILYSLLPNGIKVPTGFAENLGQVINSVLSFVMVISALLVLLYLIWGAFDWITSGGDKGKIESARKKIIAAIVGLIIVASSFAIFLLAIKFLGFANLDELFSSTQPIGGTQESSLQQLMDATPSGQTQ